MKKVCFFAVSFVLILLGFCGCKTSTSPSEGASQCVRQDVECAKWGQKAKLASVAGRPEQAIVLYQRILDRAMSLDLLPEMRYAALCLAAYALNDEKDADVARYLRLVEEVGPLSKMESLRFSDLSFRLAKREKRDGSLFWNRFCTLKKLTNAVEVDAALTVVEETMDQGKPVDTVWLKDIYESALVTGGSVAVRAKALQARHDGDPAWWREAAREYARMGNRILAFRTAYQCAEVLRNEEAAGVAERMALGAHDQHRVLMAQKLKESIKGKHE